MHALSPREEFANALTHGVGALAAFVGGAALIVLAAMQGDRWRLVAAIVFATSLLLLYVASTLYHCARHPDAKARLDRFSDGLVQQIEALSRIAGEFSDFAQMPRARPDTSRPIARRTCRSITASVSRPSARSPFWASRITSCGEAAAWTGRPGRRPQDGGVVSGLL